MKPAVALAMLEREGRWLLQLRDDIDSIIYPGHWGLFGGHLDPGETASEAVHRELQEEIAWSPSVPLEPWFSDDSSPRVPRKAQRAREPTAVEGGPGDEVGVPQ
jgi:8-oxo-dGTP diphosphatase